MPHTKTQSSILLQVIKNKLQQRTFIYSNTIYSVRRPIKKYTQTNQIQRKLWSTTSVRVNIYLPICKTALYSPPLCSRVNLKLTRLFFSTFSTAFAFIREDIVTMVAIIASVVSCSMFQLLHLASLPYRSMDACSSVSSFFALRFLSSCSLSSWFI